MILFGIRILKKLGLLAKVNIVGDVRLGNKKFKIPIIKKMGYFNLFMNEQWMLELLNILPIKKGCFIDVGVNVGQTLLKVRSVHPDIQYIGFEPNSACTYYLQELIKINKLENIKIIPSGISDFDGIENLFFFTEQTTDSGASVIENFRPGEVIFKKEIVVMNRFETILKKIDIESIQTIKIDVEGCELEVLKGFEKSLQNFRPQFLLEVLPVYDASENKERYDRQIQIESLFLKNSYSLFRVIKEKDRFKSLQLIDSIGIHSDISHCDYLALPNNVAKEWMQDNAHYFG